MKNFNTLPRKTMAFVAVSISSFVAAEVTTPMHTGVAQTPEIKVAEQPAAYNLDEFRAAASDLCRGLYFDNPGRCDGANSEVQESHTDTVDVTAQLAELCRNIYFDNPDRCQSE